MPPSDAPVAFHDSVLAVQNAEFVTLGQLDLLLFAVGFETRATYIAKRSACHVDALIGLGFPERHVIAYDNNAEWAKAAASEFHELDDDAFRDWASNFPLPMAGRVGIDVSSFSRDRIGALIKRLFTWTGEAGEREFVILYSPGRFSRRALRAARVNLGSAELLPGYEGMVVDPELALTAIVGLGYEPGRALGAIEVLEASLATAFLPIGIDPEYEIHVRRANEALLKSDGVVVQLPYRVLDPSTLFEEIARLIVGTSRTGRCVLVPLGPKIFAAVACVAALDVVPQTPVWRVSGGQSELPIDSAPEGPIVAVRMSRVLSEQSSTPVAGD